MTQRPMSQVRPQDPAPLPARGARPAELTAAQIDAVDSAVARFARGGQPGLAYGVVTAGELAHSGGLGERWLDGPAPDADTVFRIASMTTSFTAAMVLALRDAGALRLDDPAQEYVGELRGLRLPAEDCEPLTIRQLLTMTAGFPTDDPWGDRQQGLPAADFARLLADNDVRLAWAPGTRFEYSNLGYAILGKVIETATGLEYAKAIRDSLLRPLGMHQTGFEPAGFSPDRLARGYRHEDDGTWLELEPDPYGAFAPMGGVFSCVRDLARWVAGFAAAFPARDAAGDDHPLGRASRREMQLAQVAIVPGGVPELRLSGPAAFSYGFGLFAEEDPEFGPIVHHSGGYPGFGSHMRWHPASGVGVVVLANGTYAPAWNLGADLLAALLRTRPAARPESCLLRGPAPAGPWQETLAARDAVNGLLRHWDDEVARRLFAPNVDLDRPVDRRRGDIARLRERIGAFSPDSGRPLECDSPAHCRWWLAGERGAVCVQIKLAPLREPLVQQFLVALPPAEGSALHHALATLIATMNDGGREWPAGLRPAGSVDAAAALLQLRIAAEWTGPCEIDCYLAGDGETEVTVRLAGSDRTAILSVAIGGGQAAASEPSGMLLRVEVALAPSPGGRRDGG